MTTTPSRFSPLARLTIIFVLAVAGRCSFAQGFLQGSHLSIGPSTVIGSSANAGIGYSHSLEGESSLALGAYISMPVETYQCFGIGYIADYFGWNYTQVLIGSWNSTRNSGYSIVLGYDNHVDAMDSSLLVGWFNTLDEGLDFSWCSVVAGMYHYVTNAHNMLVSGESNVVDSAVDGAAIGFGLINTEENHIVVGKYNQPAVASSPPVFTVANGTGTDPAQKSNALVVYHNGDVIIKKAQGDILMGQFGN